MGIGQAGKRAKQFSSQQQKRYQMQYQGQSQEPLIQRTPAMSRAQTTNNNDVPIARFETTQQFNASAPDIQRTSPAPVTATQQSSAEGAEDNNQTIGRASEDRQPASANDDGDQAISPEIIAEKVYDLLLEETRTYQERIGRRR